MKQITQVLEGIGSVVQLFLRSIAYAGTLPRQSARFIEQCYMIGYTTLPIVAVLSFFIGMVLALEAGYAMEGFGAKEFIGSLVGLSMARELGPMMTSVTLTTATFQVMPPDSTVFRYSGSRRAAPYRLPMLSGIRSGCRI